MPPEISRQSFLVRVAGGAASLIGFGMTSPAFAETPASTPISFAETAPGALPPGFAPALTGGGGPVRWQVVADESTPSRRVLAQTSTDRTDARFPICIYEGVSARDIDVTVRFKPISGRVDQAGGIIIRAMDASNYYVARANALENNVRLYHVIRGRRTQFAGADAGVKAGVWQTLRLRAEGTQFAVYFDGKRLFEATDSRLPGPGRLGLWTKADSVTHFDQLAYSVLGK